METFSGGEDIKEGVLGKSQNGNRANGVRQQEVNGEVVGLGGQLTAGILSLSIKPLNMCTVLSKQFHGNSSTLYAQSQTEHWTWDLNTEFPS